jgi:hypothetical protein
VEQKTGIRKIALAELKTFGFIVRYDRNGIAPTDHYACSLKLKAREQTDLKVSSVGWSNPYPLRMAAIQA